MLLLLSLRWSCIQRFNNDATQYCVSLPTNFLLMRLLLVSVVYRDYGGTVQYY